MALVIDYSSGIFEAAPSGETVGTDPATIGDPNFANVSLLLHMDGSNGSTTFTDSSSNGLTVTANGNAQISTTQSKFGGSSAYFDGTGDYLSFSASDEWGFGDGAWTIEFFINTTDTDFDPIAAFNPSSPYEGWSIRVESGLVKFFQSNGSTNDGFDTVSGTTTVNDGAWHHVALTSASGSNAVSCYIDGILAGSHTFTVAISTSGQALRVGADTNTTILRPLNGYIDELRITKGVARYTSNFTAPTAAFSDQGPTVSATTGNVFNHAPSADVAYTFSNPPTTGSAYDFTLKVAPTATVAITWPSSVKWAGGTAPSAPANGEKDVYSFFTLDGGTTYYGFQAGDAMA